MRFINFISFILFITILLVIQCYTLSDFNMALLYVLFSIYTGWLIWETQGRKISVFLFFMLTYHLFIGGRFFSYLLDRELNIFEPTFFYYYNVNYQDKIKVFSFVLAFMFFSVLGHNQNYLNKNKKPFLYNPKTDIGKYDLSRMLNIALPIFALIIIPKRINSILETIEIGYGKMELGAEINYSLLDKFSNMGFCLFLGLAIAYSEKKIIIKYYTLYLVTSILTILSGSRAALGSCVLMSIWTFSQFYKIKLRKLFLSLFVGLTFMLYLFSHSARSEQSGNDNFNLFDGINEFIYSNGGSLMVHEVSTRISDYPTLNYVQTFITGSNFIYSFFSGTPLKPHEASFQGHLCYELNPELYYSGAGLGWTTISDLYLFSGGILPFFCILSFFIGYLISNIDVALKNNRFFVYVAASLSPGIYMMARGSISAIFAMLPYIYVFYFLICKIYARKKNSVFKYKLK